MLKNVEIRIPPMRMNETGFDNLFIVRLKLRSKTPSRSETAIGLNGIIQPKLDK
tara:strand:+ start:225 stop:386 length:162 start_codon:yes stop_codon:yes gene_type:complete